jgi:hypothetical protein
MFFYLNLKTNNKFNEDVLLISIVSYIIIIAYIKYFENKNNIYNFFDIYIILILLLDLFFSSILYLKQKFNDFKNYDKNIFLNSDDKLNKIYDIYTIDDDFFDKINKKINLDIKNIIKKKKKIITDTETENNKNGNENESKNENEKETENGK